MSSDLTDLQNRYDRLRLLYQVSNVIHSTLDPQEALELILREAVANDARLQRFGGPDESHDRFPRN